MVACKHCGKNVTVRGPPFCGGKSGTCFTEFMKKQRLAACKACPTCKKPHTQIPEQKQDCADCAEAKRVAELETCSQRRCSNKHAGAALPTTPIPCASCTEKLEREAKQAARRVRVVICLHHGVDGIRCPNDSGAGKAYCSDHIDEHAADFATIVTKNFVRHFKVGEEAELLAYLIELIGTSELIALDLHKTLDLAEDQIMKIAKIMTIVVSWVGSRHNGTVVSAFEDEIFARVASGQIFAGMVVHGAGERSSPDAPKPVICKMLNSNGGLLGFADDDAAWCAGVEATCPGINTHVAMSADGLLEWLAGFDG
jgi:hypothetical protein